MNSHLAGRIAVITGAASGIGEGLATYAAQCGMIVAIADMNGDALQGVAARLTEAGATVHARRLDIRDRAAIATWVDEVATYGDVARLFANAGVLRTGAILSQDAADIDLLIDINLKGTLNTIRAFAPLLIRQATSSRIVITGSQAAVIAYPGLAAYGASKHALWAIADTLRGELAAEAPQVGVSFVCPGAVSTGMSGKRDPNPGEEQDSMSPLRLAEIAFAGADRGDFYIFSHPEVRPAVEARMGGMIAAIR